MWDLKDVELQSSVSIIHRQMNERSEIASRNVCPLCLYLFISHFYYLKHLCWFTRLGACEGMRACLHVVIHNFLQDCVTIFQLTCRSGAWSLVPAFQNDKVYLSVF